MAKKKAARKKSAKTRTSKTVKSRPKPVKARGPKKRAVKKPAKLTPVLRKISELVYGPSFFLTANSDTSPAYEIDGTPHPQTIESYRLAKAAIREFEEQDGKILYKIKPLLSPVG
jgi:hypothetical protein